MEQPWRSFEDLSHRQWLYCSCYKMIASKHGMGNRLTACTDEPLVFRKMAVAGVQFQALMRCSLTGSQAGMFRSWSSRKRVLSGPAEVGSTPSTHLAPAQQKQLAMFSDKWPIRLWVKSSLNFQKNASIYTSNISMACLLPYSPVDKRNARFSLEVKLITSLWFPPDILELSLLNIP